MNEERKRKGMAELEAMEAEQEKRREAYERELQHELQDRRVQRGIEALIRATIEDVSAEIAAEVAAVNAPQIHRLALRLSEFGLLDLNPDVVRAPEEEVGLTTINDFETGEVAIALAIGDSIFHERGTTLIEHQTRKGRMQRREFAKDGTPQPWEDVVDVPPPNAPLN